MLTNLACAAVLTLLPLGPDDPERREPDAGAPAHEVFAWTSEDGLRYTWWLPEDYDPEVPRNLTVICHGTGLDYRWGHWNNKVKVFRPDDIVISVDGPTPKGESRLFMGNKKDAEAVRDFLHEMRAAFAVERVFLYGHSQGGFFVVYFAGEFPGEVAGVVAHASGAWNWSKANKSVHPVAISFMHGTKDPVVPYRQSPGSRDHYADKKFPLLHLRRLEAYNHWPNAVRANECLAWCQGMTCTEPAEALALAREILRPKGMDEYQWETAVGFAAARDVLRRLVGEGPAAFDMVDDKLAADARKVIDAIEKQGARHVKELEKQMKGKYELDRGEWLGHLIALREDFRGVDSVEEFVKGIGFDKKSKSQERPVSKILDAWFREGIRPPDLFDAIVSNIGDAFLFEGFPPELVDRMEGWQGAAKTLKLDKKALKKWPAFEAWRDNWKQGSEGYRDLWRKWKGAPR